MKQYIKIRKKGDLQADYVNIVDKNTFRFLLLQKILKIYQQAVLYIDTNQRAIASQDANVVLDTFKQQGVEPLVVRIPADPQSFFGLQLRVFNKDSVENIIIAEINNMQLSSSLIDVLACYDIAIGIEQLETVSNADGNLGFNGISAFSACFKELIYDSAVCARIKSTLDISRYIEETANEMGI